MSAHAVELALYEIGTRRDVRREFEQNPAACLAAYKLTAQEAQHLRACDVATLYAGGANPMTLMGFWLAVKGPREMSGFLAAMPLLSERAGHG